VLHSSASAANSGAGVASVALGTPVAGQADPHPAWKRQFAVLLDRLGADDDDLGWRQRERLENFIATTPAATLAGVREQIGLVARHVLQGPESPASRSGSSRARRGLNRLA